MSSHLIFRSKNIMTKKVTSILQISLFLGIFLIAFVINYKKSARLRKLVKVAIMLAIVLLSSKPVGAKSSGLPGADGFTPLLPAHLRPMNPGSDLFDQPKPENQKFGSDNPGDGSGGNGDDNNSDPQPESLEYSKPRSPYDEYSNMCEPSPLSDTESGSTSDESESDGAFAKDLFITASDGQRVNLDKDQLNVGPL